MTTLSNLIAAEARLIILRELAAQPDYALNESILQATLATFGIIKPSDYVREQLRRLADLDAVTLAEVGSVMVAKLTVKGLDHADGRLVIEGVKRPSPRGG